MHRTRAWYLLVLTLGFNGGNPLQCSCLENPRDGGAWWAAISGVAQSQTQLMRLSSSSRADILILSHPRCVLAPVVV